MSNYYHRYNNVTEANAAKPSFVAGEHVCLIGTFTKNEGSMTGTFGPNSSMTYVVTEEMKYNMCEFIQLTGAQYIDINYTINNTCKVVSTGAFTSSFTQQRWFSSHYATDPPAGCFEVYENGSKYYAFSYTTGTWQTTNKSITDYASSKLEVTYDMKNHIARLYNTSNNTVLYNHTTGKSYNTFNEKLYIGARLNSNTSVATISGHATYGRLKIYSFALYDNDVLVRDLIPAQRKLDLVYGLFDRVSKKFYTSATSTPLQGG